MPEALMLDKAQPSSRSVALPVKRNRSEDGRVGGPGPRTIPATRTSDTFGKGNGNTTTGVLPKDIQGPRSDSPVAARIPSYLNKSRTEISLAFQDLEWRQRFRIQHALNNSDTSPYHFDRSPIVISRNRYGNVQPWDGQRVKLQRPYHGIDYINASPIVLRDGHKSGARPYPTSASKIKSAGDHTLPHWNVGATRDTSDRTVHAIEESRYVATQGPKEGQYLPFWQMVMQETVGDIGVIVMLTPCYEGIREKCARYFPQNMANAVLVLEDDSYLDNVRDNGVNGDSTPNSGLTASDHPNDQPRTSSLSAPTESLNLGGEQTNHPEEETSSTPPSDFRSTSPNSVTLLSLHYDANVGCEVRHLQLQLRSEQKQIYHYLFPGWPDYSKPDRSTKDALIRLMHLTRDIAENQGRGGWQNPRIVHCSAGVGRTGTFIALDWLLHELEMGRLVENNEKTRGQHNITATSTQASNLDAVSSNQAIKTTTTELTEQDKEDISDAPLAKQETWGASGPVKMPRPTSISTSHHKTSTATHPRLMTPDPNANDPFTNNPNHDPYSVETSPDPNATATSNSTSTMSSSSTTATDQIYETVNALREQRMMMVMNEIQYSFIHEVVKDEFVKFYRWKPTGAVAVGKTMNAGAGSVVTRAEGGREEAAGDGRIGSGDMGKDGEEVGQEERVVTGVGVDSRTGERMLGTKEVDVEEEETPSEAETDIVPEDYRIDDD